MRDESRGGETAQSIRELWDKVNSLKSVPEGAGRLGQEIPSENGQELSKVKEVVGARISHKSHTS